MTSGKGLRVYVSMSVRGTRIALSQFGRPMWAAARPTLLAITAAPRSVCWYRYQIVWTVRPSGAAHPPDQRPREKGRPIAAHIG
jgi:hypothetical protein